ncbi:lipopolysaccharide-induced tumor necrosis factor-alpha factor homolog isoform X2 [Cephus cinctus]|uniref:Lipopolysaccharide-induced tumor necrosis factor-alpha factor homolog isoform X2 n=1 Tax=Cephus cinctus TaxID=211228 RepID=A0AAJ7C1X8_CEPCN|nr:lipopolysaccharide-induced tumor necrosis factor-alpha factor homolog isoform X2 [Cephus cinctus]XP_015599909.1 lipopolysaccharide-induced tumor necrosis factor-alpha factor homolog isoform X2 [Cephus cinctus]XP_024943099.1 lipopolysaccharide-induced tumor necrosis factor-alpha factor homolog isoform X2 [Cephus cinctus]
MDKQGPPPPGFAPPPPYSGPPPMNPGHMAQPNIIIMQNPNLGPDTQPMTCPHCHANISTRVVQESSTKTHLFALLLCLMGCWPCAPCPYCMDSCLATKHYCPACNAFLGQYDN